MRKVSVAQASGSLGKYAAELKREIVVVTKGKRMLAALVPLANVDQESLALSMHPEFLSLAKRARAEIVAGRSLSLGEMRERVVPAAGKASNPRFQRTAPTRRR